MTPPLQPESHVPNQLALSPDGFTVRPTLIQRAEAYISRLSTKNNFWHRVCSLIWLPFAWRSGIHMKQFQDAKFAAILPFKRVNRNWYNAMAGAALLGNSEVAAGMFLFGECGSDYNVVCKQMKYDFLRPCLGPAVYTIRDGEEVTSTVQTQKTEGGEFNIDLELEIKQILKKRGRDLRVGRCAMTFHCTPKRMIEAKMQRRKLSAKRRGE
jgi:hypothetical protein